MNNLPRSDDVAAWFRGLSQATRPPVASTFVYTNCLDREYDDYVKNVEIVKFDISRYGKYEQTIAFGTPVSEKKAIETVESHLSQPLTQEYFEKIKDDIFHDNLT